jgi:hypothetical protein
MLVEVGGKKTVSWTHEVKFDRERLMKGADEKLLKALELSTGRTICTIEDAAGAKMVGVTYCSKKDSFDFFKGMEEALKKALWPNVPRGDRKPYWDAFLGLKKEGMQFLVRA